MAGQSQDQFEAYFRRADLDGDGRISGAEAVAFFQGSGLTKQVLAQIWMHADQRNSGFLGRQEFFNALKLVTVAQSKRELTPEIVKAALYGPAAAKIPAPQINSPVTSASQMGAVAAPVSQNPGFGGPGAPNPSMSQPYYPSQQSQSIRPLQAIPSATAPHLPQGISAPRPIQGTTGPRSPQGVTSPEFSRGFGMVGQAQAMPAASASHPLQSMPITTGPAFSSQSMSNNWVGGTTGGAPTGPRGIAPLTPSAVSKPQTAFSMSSQPVASDSKALMVSGNGFAPDSGFGGGAFSATPSKPEPSKQTNSPSIVPASSAIVPASSGVQPIVKSNSLDSLQSAFSMQAAGSQNQQSHSSFNLGQQVSAQSAPSTVSSGISVAVGNSTSENTQVPWPKMKPSDVQKYTKVFMEVDSDRDGKITGEQARNLFLSWRLPREVLKQVWDLSDQDSDSMLSLREFCFSLYLMERYREGRPLPAVLPRNVMFDETLLSMTGQPNVAHGNAAWGPNSGFGQQQGIVVRPMTPSTGLRPPIPPTTNADTTMMSNQRKPGAPVLDDSFGNRLHNGDSVNSEVQDAATDEKKADVTQNVILDSKEKIEFYRTKMQELVLYKSRCDNRLNEITERAIADKREAEMLAKKYEEKYKQVAEIASKLTIEEAKFRETQERKTELHQAILNVEQGGSADGILQVRADRIQSDFEELMKALTERCKKHGCEIKSSALIELPIGWQPGIPEGAAIWDEEWDKFEDEGFGNELTVNVQSSAPVQREKTSPDGSFTPDSLSNADEKHGNLFSTGERALESESAYTHSEDESARSPHGSPLGRTAPESPSEQFSDGPFRKSTEADAETHRSFDESGWGAFDNDDTDSVWGFNPSNTKDTDSDKHRDFFGSNDFGLNPIRTDSLSAESAFDKRSPFIFDDSVPETPASKFGNSPSRFSEVSRDHFDSFSRFDSFSMHDSGFSSQPERLTRFDSISSTKDFGRGFSFDDNDPFGSSGPFKVSSDNHSPKKATDNWSSF